MRASFFLDYWWRSESREVTQMVENEKKDRRKMPAKQAGQETLSEADKIGASTPFNCRCHAYLPSRSTASILRTRRSSSLLFHCSSAARRSDCSAASGRPIARYTNARSL